MKNALTAALALLEMAIPLGHDEGGTPYDRMRKVPFDTVEAHDEWTSVETIPTPDPGIWHHYYRGVASRVDGRTSKHVLSTSPDPRDQSAVVAINDVFEVNPRSELHMKTHSLVAATLPAKILRDHPIIPVSQMIRVKPGMEGRGYGSRLLQAIAARHGVYVSDGIVSDEAHGMWTGVKTRVERQKQAIRKMGRSATVRTSDLPSIKIAPRTVDNPNYYVHHTERSRPVARLIPNLRAMRAPGEEAVGTIRNMISYPVR